MKMMMCDKCEYKKPLNPRWQIYICLDCYKDSYYRVGEREKICTWCKSTNTKLLDRLDNSQCFKCKEGIITIVDEGRGKRDERV